MSGAAARKVRWEEMFPEELMQAIEACPVCYAAFGLAEPHGAYNAIGLDWLKAQALLERAALTHAGVVAPPCAWHVAEAPHLPWVYLMGVKQPLCSSIPADLFLRLALYVLRAIDARGFHAAILVSGHYGGLEVDLRLVCEYYLRRSGSPLRLWAGGDWELIRFENYRGDHAGICETAQLMALRPGLTDLARTDEAAAHGPWIGRKFPLPDGRMPSPELGERIVNSQIERLGEIQRELLAGYRPREGWRGPSLAETEDVWNRFEKLTRKYWIMSMTWDEYTKNQRVPFPGWEALGE